MKKIIFFIICVSVCITAYSKNTNKYESFSRTGENYHMSDDTTDNLSKLEKRYVSGLITRDEFIQELSRRSKDRLTPGQHLQKGANLIYTGFGFSILAAVPFVLPNFNDGITDKTTGITTGERNVNYAVGAMLGLTGIVCYLSGIGHIKKAGKKLDIMTSQNSIGLVIKF